MLKYFAITLLLFLLIRILFLILLEFKNIEKYWFENDEYSFFLNIRYYKYIEDKSTNLENKVYYTKQIILWRKK
jgi:hypothetical protein